MTSCTIIVTDANALTRPIHDRMPVVLDKTDIGPWLNGAAGTELLRPISPSHTPASGSGRRRPRGLVFCDGNRGSAPIRYAVAVENPAFAAATAGTWV